MSFFVYIIRTSANTLYTGYTNDLEKRLKTHKSKTNRAAKYLRSFTSLEMVYFEEFKTKSEALKREYELKTWTKAKKEKLISSKPLLFRS